MPIRERFRITDRSNPYYPYALGTSDYSTLSEWPGGGVIGIHGDFGQPQPIPGDPSHGCVRMQSPDIAWLGPRVTIGTPVDVICPMRCATRLEGIFTTVPLYG
jgi:lipoprotein-anchoring transpeptidase ErfK/SrfK